MTALFRLVDELVGRSSPAPVLLRRLLLADAAISGGAGLAMLLGADALGELLGLSPALLRWVGLVLLPFAALVAYLATRVRITPAATLGVVAANLLWAVCSLLLLVIGWVEPTAVGYVFIVGQALAVALCAEVQYVGLRKISAMSV
jgi:hypothetical protein